MSGSFKLGKYPPKDQIIIGLHAIGEVLAYAPEKIVKIFTEPGKKERKEKILELAKERRIEVVFVSKEILTEMSGTDSHQSFAAQIKGRNYIDPKDFLKRQKEKSLVLMLDQIFDPQNFGALLRAAECFGADGVVWSKNRGAELTPSASKASSGASELIPLLRVSNLASTALEFQEAGYELVCAALTPEAKNLFSFTFPPRTLLVVGSEGEGIQPLLLKRADHVIHIPMKGKIGSLNVSQAASVLLSYAARS